MAGGRTSSWVGTKARLGLVLWLACASFLFAQNSTRTIHHDVHHDISPPLSELALGAGAAPQSAGAPADPDAADERENAAFKDSPYSATRTSSPARADAGKSSVGVTMLANIDGQSDTNSWSVPDSDGVVGDTQYVQWINVEYVVYSKATGAKLLGPILGKTLWSGFGGPCQTANSGDPIAQFDKAAHRWVLTQHATPSSGSSYDCVAVSTTSDATGSYYRYAFQLSAYYPDYPKLGVWPDAYYLTIDEQNAAKSYAYVDAKACALQRSAMLTGASALAVCFTTSGPAVHSLLPADLDGSIAPPSGSPNYLMNLGATALNLWKFHVDFATTSNSTFTGPTTIPVNAFTKACNGGVCVPQAGVTQLVDSLADRLMWRLAYRHFADGHESLVVNHAVSLGSSAGVRWYEIQRPGSTPIVVQQNTISPDSNYRWLGSIAMDHMGDIAVGYSESSASINPAVYINGRLATDPLNTMQGEMLVVAGAGSESGSNRWGDYSAMTIDPTDDCTFWYTNQYFLTTGSFNWKTRIAKFKFPNCSLSQPAVTLVPTTLFYGGQPVGTTAATQTITLTNNQTVALTVSDVSVSGDFLETDNCQPSVAAGASCTITVKFSPSAGGIRTGQIIISDAAANSPQIANLTGTGTTPVASLSSTELFYGVHAVGTVSNGQTVIVTNTGRAPLNITAVYASGGYGVSTTCTGNAIPVGGTCSVTAKFVPSVLGLNNGWVTIADNAPGGPQLLALTGAGSPALSLSPATFAFGTVSVGASSTPQTLTLTNHRSTAINFTYSASGSYAAVAGGATPCGSSLAAGSQCTLQVAFTPQSSGVINGAVSFVHNAAGSPQSVGLFGTGSGGSTPPLSFQFSSLNFGSVLLGTTSAAQTVFVTNNSSAAITFTSVTASADYSVSGCVGSLAAGKVCQITVKFTPTLGQSVAGAITFRDNATVGTQSISLTGVGLLPMTLAPATLTFAAQNVGTTSATQTVTVTNNQATALTINGFYSSGQFGAKAAGANPCTNTLAAKASCTYVVTFNPAIKGAIGGAFTITHNANTSPQIVELSGTGQ